MSKKNKFHWNQDTIEYFAKIEFNERFNKMFDFVKYECDLEEGESVQDLYNDLNRQVLLHNNPHMKEQMISLLNRLTE